MRGCKLFPDLAGYVEVALTQLGQVVFIGLRDCDVEVPNEHTRLSRTHVTVKVVGRAYE